MPKIIFITRLHLWSMDKGKGNISITQTIKKYLDENWEVFLISDNPINKDYPALDEAHNIVLPPSRFKRFDQVRKIGVLFRHLDHHAVTKALCAAARKVMDGNAKDTVLYGYEVHGVDASLQLSRETGAPLVTRFQGTILSYLPNTWLQRFRRYPHFHALSTKADLVIMTDDGSFGARTLSELGNDSPTLFLRNGLDLMERDLAAMKAAFDRNAFRASLGVREDELMFLTVSRLVGWKRLERAIDGFAAFCRQSPQGRLVIVGDGNERPHLERRVNDLGIADRVVFTGAVLHDDVYDYMMACDVFMSFYDLTNVGNPLLEAMTLGKCIVTLDVGDTRSIVQDGDNAVLLTMETLPSLGNVLEKLAGDAALRERLSAGAAAYAQEHFYSWKKRMDIEFQAVSKLLKG